MTTARGAARIGLFGLFGSGNIGNDASMEAMLHFLRRRYPGAVVDVMCGGPDNVEARHGIGAVHLYWHSPREAGSSGLRRRALQGFGKSRDTLRIARWVRTHDLVVVPGTGILEATLPLRPWETPWALFALGLFARIFGTKVALVSVGASPVTSRAIRWLQNHAAKLASYRSYRDGFSRTAMARRGVDTGRDPVFPDLVFSLPVPAHNPGDPGTVGIGLMDYSGAPEDRGRGAAIRTAYVERMREVVGLLVDEGQSIRFFIGDADDERVVQEIMSDLRASRPGLAPGRAIAEPITSFAELSEAMGPVDVVVASRHHNLICALMLGKPVVALAYANKSTELMGALGLAEFCQPVASFDVPRLIGQVRSVRKLAEQIRETTAERRREESRRLDEQFALLSDLLAG